ncbi:LOW QUALITY PROTEIN: cytochrome c-type biogenesis protein CcdA [Geomicrobium sp. JCM 19055]|nr:LOW QUALITY PROTEIN: cytochrome c-type biogenesis protein CcdA [Geomicrobium sp. JCM 19055]
MESVTLGLAGLAFVAGMVSFFSPCIFPLVPAYLAQLTGSNISGSSVQTQKRIILSRSFGFILGFTVIFFIDGVASTFIGQAFRMYSGLLEQLGGILIVLFGLQMSGLISIRALLMDKRIGKPRRSTSFLGSFGFGLVFASGWTPCVGVVLGSVLALASSQSSGDMFAGVGMLLLYSLGLGIPFLLVALLFSNSLNRLSTINRYLPTLQKASGVLLIVLGVLLISGYFQILSTWLASFTNGWM